MSEAVPGRPASGRGRLRALLAVAALTAGLLTLPTVAVPASAALPPGHGEVVVTVTDARTGAPVVDAGVQAVEQAPGDGYASEWTDASGRATLTLPAGRYDVEIDHERYVGGPLPQAVVVVAGAPTPVAARLERGSTIRAMISFDRRPAPGVFVTAERITGDYSRSCTTGPDGSCELAGLPAGEYRGLASPLGADDPDYTFYGDAEWLAGGSTLHVGADAVVEVAVELQPQGLLAGTVALPFALAGGDVGVGVAVEYLDDGSGEDTDYAFLDIAPGATAPFSVQVDTGRPFRIALEGYRADRSVLLRQYWTPSGMAAEGSSLQVGFSEKREVQLTGTLGASIEGTISVASVPGTRASGLAMAAPAPRALPGGAAPDLRAAAGARPDSSVDGFFAEREAAQRQDTAAGAPRAADSPAEDGAVGDPLAAITLYQELEDGLWPIDWTIVGGAEMLDRTVPFAFGGLAPGSYTLRFEGEPCSEYWRDQPTLESATRIRITAAGTVVPIAASLRSDAAGCPDVALPDAARLSGSDRYETAIAISQSSYWDGGAQVVYLASGQNYPDGLAAGPAAAHQGGPVLLTPTASIPQSVLDEIERLGPAQIVIVGGEPSVSGAVERAVRGLGIGEVVRLGGTDRFHTSRLVAEHAFAEGADSAFFATGFKFPDALAAGPAAAALGGPVLLVNGTTATLDAATRTTVSALGIRWAGVVGDGQSVSAGIEADLAGRVGAADRFAGADRFATAAALGEVFSMAPVVFVASGEGFADALPGAAAAGAWGAPMVLARSGCMPEVTRTTIERWGPELTILLGGEPTLGRSTASYVTC